MEYAVCRCNIFLKIYIYICICIKHRYIHLCVHVYIYIYVCCIYYIYMVVAPPIPKTKLKISCTWGRSRAYKCFTMGTLNPKKLGYMGPLKYIHFVHWNCTSKYGYPPSRFQSKLTICCCARFFGRVTDAIIPFSTNGDSRLKTCNHVDDKL